MNNSLDSWIVVGFAGTLESQGDVLNDGNIDNAGSIVLYQDWINNNYYNGLNGSFVFTGFQAQRVFDDDLVIGTLVVDADDTVVFEGAQTEIDNLIRFDRGILKSQGRFVVDNSARVDMNPSGDSYFDGTLILQGGSEDPGEIDQIPKRFPIGSNGQYNPIEFQDIRSADGELYELAVSVSHPNTVPPLPDSTELLGVADEAVWNIELLTDSGTLQSAKVYLDFMDIDLEDFEIFNDIAADRIGPVVVKADSLDGTFTNLGASDYIGDSSSFGQIWSLDSITFSDREQYVGVGISALVPEEGVVYIPEVFSPNATDIRNQAFRVFGEKILEEDFSLVLINQYNSVVYRTNSFEEANSVGWNGTINGQDAAAGIYYYQVTLRRQGMEEIEKYSGPFYLLR